MPAALTFTAGLLTVAAIEDMVSEAHESGDDTHISPLAFIGGFVLFVLVSAGLKGWYRKANVLFLNTATVVLAEYEAAPSLRRT